MIKFLLNNLWWIIPLLLAIPIGIVLGNDDEKNGYYEIENNDCTCDIDVI